MIRKISFLTLLVISSLLVCLCSRPAFGMCIRSGQKVMGLSLPISVKEEGDKKKEAKHKTAKDKTTEDKKAKDKAPVLSGKYLVGRPILIRELGIVQKNFKLERCSGASDPGECIPLDQPPRINAIFNLRATDDSGRPIRINAKVMGGKAHIDPYEDRRGALRVLPRDPGKLVLEVTTSSWGYNSSFLTLYVAGAPGSELSSCARLFPADIQQPPVLGASMIIRLIGTPDPYFLEPATEGKLLIYSKYPIQDDPTRIRERILGKIKDQIKELSRYEPDALGLETSKPFSVEISVPHAAELGDISAKIASLNNSKFTATRVGSDRIRITSAAQPDCGAWSGYLGNLQRLVWGTNPESPSARLFYLDAADVSKALSSSAQSAQSNTGSGAQSGQSNTGSNTSGQQPSAGGTGGQSASGASGAAAPGTAGVSPTGTTKPDAPPPLKSQASISSLKDVLVFNSANPGDDAEIVEKKRIVAILDLPRPEMIVNAWVMQSSSKDPRLVSRFSDLVAQKVSAFNDALELSVSRGWLYLNGRVNTPNSFFDETFYRYIGWRYIGELPYRSGVPASADQGAQEVLELRSPASLSPEYRARHNTCGDNEYCLGYGALFNPLKPRLTDLLLTVIAAAHPADEVRVAIQKMESSQNDGPTCSSGVGHSDYCEKLRSRLGITRTSAGGGDCVARDLAEILGSASYDSLPVLHLECFRRKAENLLRVGSDSQLGLLRASIADFLFNYKMSQQYPHEFSPYDLSQSAVLLNTALSPFIESFNQDLKAFQTFLQEDLRYRVDGLSGGGSWLFGGGKQSFINNGIVSVRTISGEPTSVDTISQSFLDASSAPQFADLAKSIVDQSIAKGANGEPTGVLGNLSANQAQVILGALQAFQSRSVQIGRSLSLKIAPRSLSAASAAEIGVTLNADESADPRYFGGPKGAQDPNTSRVAKHDTTTRIRVDSIKLFEVSAFSAELQRSRSQFPLLPPFVEIPYIGTLIGIPLPPAKQYHTSTAVLSAIVVPTAADLAYGLNFISDRILDAPGTNDCNTTGEAAEGTGRQICVRKALSLSDFHKPIRNFNKEKAKCFATQTTPVQCQRLTFDYILRDPSDR